MFIHLFTVTNLINKIFAISKLRFSLHVVALNVSNLAVVLKHSFIPELRYKNISPYFEHLNQILGILISGIKIKSKYFFWKISLKSGV
jgi:hypothetical protein